MDDTKERANFEATMKGVVIGPWMFDAREGEYSFAGMRLAWMAWKARAALAAQCVPAGDHLTTAYRMAKALADHLATSPAPAQAQQTEGLSTAQEPKYTVNGCTIINRASGEPIPSDEPIFVFRARDVHAREALEAYAAVILPGDHRDAVVQRIADFAAFAHANPARMKEPDTAQEAPALAQQAADWTDVRMELEAAGRDDLSRFVESATEPAQAQQAAPLTQAQRIRLWDNSPQVHGDVVGRDAFERLVKLVESVHRIGASSGSAS